MTSEHGAFWTSLAGGVGDLDYPRHHVCDFSKAGSGSSREAFLVACHLPPVEVRTTNFAAGLDGEAFTHDASWPAAGNGARCIVLPRSRLLRKWRAEAIAAASTVPIDNEELKKNFGHFPSWPWCKYPTEFGAALQSRIPVPLDPDYQVVSCPPSRGREHIEFFVTLGDHVFGACLSGSLGVAKRLTENKPDSTMSKIQLGPQWAKVEGFNGEFPPAIVSQRANGQIWFLSEIRSFGEPAGNRRTGEFKVVVTDPALTSFRFYSLATTLSPDFTCNDIDETKRRKI